MGLAINKGKSAKEAADLKFDADTVLAKKQAPNDLKSAAKKAAVENEEASNAVRRVSANISAESKKSEGVKIKMHVKKPAE